MRNISLLALALVVISALALAGCGRRAGEIVSHRGPVQDYVSLIDALRASQLTVEPAGEISQPFFTEKGMVVKVNGEDVQIFEFSDASAAQAAAEGISKDGFEIKSVDGGITMVEWVAAPHFFQLDKLIVLYVGENNSLVEGLSAVLGPQFAGN